MSLSKGKCLLWSLWTLLMILVLAGCSGIQTTPPASRYSLVPPSSSTKAVSGELRASFLCLNNGEACLVNLPNGETMLVDTGGFDHGPDVFASLKGMKVDKIDHLVLTNVGDSHHTSNVITILNNSQVGKVYFPSRGLSLKGATQVLDAIDIVKAKNIPIIDVKTGLRILDLKNLGAMFLGPDDPLADCSAAFALTYGNHTFLFADDGHSKAERKIVEAQGTPSVHVISVGNTHRNLDGPKDVGSMVKKTQPEIAVIYGDVASDQLKGLKTEILRPNDLAPSARPATSNSILVVSSDGKKLTSAKTTLPAGVK